MDLSVLESIGLSFIEIKVFIRTLELGETKAGKIIELTGLQSSSVYNAINSLINKGLISHIRKGNIKYYKAANPEVILDYIDLKKAEYIRLLPELKIRQQKKEEESVELYKTYKGIKNITSELLRDTKKGDVCRTFAVQDPKEYNLARKHVFSLTKKLFKEKKIQIRGLFHEKTRYAPSKDSIVKKRYVDYPLPPNMMMVNNKTVIISWSGNDPTGVIIVSESIARAYINFFDHLWKIGEK